MLGLFYPGAFAEQPDDIDFDDLYRRGIRALIFDIDNTLVPHGADSTAEVDRKMAELRAIGFRLFFLSNNGRERVERFLKNIDGEYLCNASKPRPKSYRAALHRMGLKRGEALVIGDQLFTDILGANLAGLDSILVRYIGYDPDEDPGKRRRLEARVLRRWFASRRCKRYEKRI